MEKYREILARVLFELFGLDAEFDFSRTDEKFGDFATNAAMVIFGSAKKDEQMREKLDQQGVKSPRDLAEKIREKLMESGEFAKVEIAGPGFLNLSIDSKNLAKTLDESFLGEQKFGTSRKNSGKTAVVEYPSPNVAKPYSVGHLRPGNQGWAAKNLLESQGWKVITDNHIGDAGSPFGYWVLGFKKYSDREKLAKRGVYELGDVYIKIRADLKAEEKAAESDPSQSTPLADEAQNWLKRLEAGDAEAEEFSRTFTEISLAHIHNVMRRLGISTQFEYGEKFFAPMGKDLVAKLVSEKKAIKNPDGSVIVSLEEQGIKTPMLLQKSNGANLYATGDLATLVWREENWHPDLTVYAVGGEQKFYFEQVAALAKKLGLKQEVYHLWFGTIDQINEDGTRSKMSSRKGVVLMEELLDFAFERAKQNAKSDDMSENDLKKISVGAIKFADFSADRRTGMLFDWDSIFSLTGFSGPYVQYAAVRAKKILRENLLANNFANFDYDFLAEKNLILKLLEYPGVVALATDKLEPHRVASYAFELAKELNKYYEKTPVATAEVQPEIREKRLEVLLKVAEVFESALGILGIEIPDKM